MLIPELIHTSCRSESSNITLVVLHKFQCFSNANQAGALVLPSPSGVQLVWVWGPGEGVLTTLGKEYVEFQEKWWTPKLLLWSDMMFGLFPRCFALHHGHGEGRRGDLWFEAYWNTENDISSSIVGSPNWPRELKTQLSFVMMLRTEGQ